MFLIIRIIIIWCILWLTLDAWRTNVWVWLGLIVMLIAIMVVSIEEGRRRARL